MTIRWPLLIVLASLTAVAPVATDLYLPGFPVMAGDLGTTASGVQLTLTTFLIGLAFGQLAMGPLADRFGRRRPLIAGTVVCALAGVACALAPSLPLLIAARIVQGFAGAAGMVIGRAIISDLAVGALTCQPLGLRATAVDKRVLRHSEHGPSTGRNPCRSDGRHRRPRLLRSAGGHLA